MTKTKTKESDFFGLSTTTTAFGLSTNGMSFLTSPGRDLSRDEQHICEEWNKQMMVIDAQADKTAFATTKIGEVHRHGALTFSTTLEYVLALKEEAEGEEYQLYMAEFSKRQLQMLGRHMLGAVEVGSSHIGGEIHRSLYPPPEPPPPPEPRSLWKRLFG